MPDIDRSPVLAALTRNKRVIFWDPTGAPVVENVPVVTKSQLSVLYSAVVAEPYLSGEPDPLHPDHEYDGMAMAEVIIRKQVLKAARTGENDDAVMDRLLGKPKQSSESVTVKMGYEDYIAKLAADEEAGRLRRAIPVPATSDSLEDDLLS